MDNLLFLDIETKDEFLTKEGINFKRKDIKILGLGILYNNTKKYYNFFVDSISNEDFTYLQNLFNTKILIGHNVSYDILGLSSIGFNFDASTLLDTIFLQSLINENEESYSLKNLSKKYLEVDKTDYLLEKNAQEVLLLKSEQRAYYKHLDKLDQEIVADYCLQDLELTKLLFELQLSKLDNLKEFI